MMSDKLAGDLVVGLIVPPILTGLWLTFVHFNNNIVERRRRGTKIEPHPWLNLMQGYLVMLVLIALDLFRR